MKTKQQVVSDFRRAEIVDAARTVFARDGYEHGMIETIAQEAGIAKGTVYLYFRSKQEIFKAVLDHDMKKLKRETLERIDGASTLREKIRAFVLARMENVETRKDFFLIMDSEQRNLSMTRSQYRNFLREPVLHLAASIDAAAKTGEIGALSAEKVAWMVADMTRGIIQRRLLGVSEASIAEEAEFLTGFVWAALKNSEAFPS